MAKLFKPHHHPDWRYLIFWKTKLQVELLLLLCQNKISALYVVFVLWSCTLHTSKTWFPFFFCIFKLFYDFLPFEFGGGETIRRGLFPVGSECSFSKPLLHPQIQKQMAKAIPHLIMRDFPEDPTRAAQRAAPSSRGSTARARGRLRGGEGSDTGARCPLDPVCDYSRYSRGGR